MYKVDWAIVRVRENLKCITAECERKAAKYHVYCAECEQKWIDKLFKISRYKAI